MTTRQDCVLKYALDHFAGVQPDEVFAVFEDGATWTWAETRDRTRRMAAALQHLGVSQGDHVIAWLPNGPEALITFFAINYIGAVHVPINTAYRGPLLAHVVENSDAALIVAHTQLVSRLADIDRAKLQCLIYAGDTPAAIDGLNMHEFEACQDGAGQPTEPSAPIEPWHMQSIIYTSGTTGPSKGVISSYMHAWSAMNAAAWPCVGPDDRFMINMPFFHVGGSFIIHGMLCRGASIAMTEGFRTDRFLPLAKQTGSTAVFLLGAMANFLDRMDPSPADRDHDLRTMFVVPLGTEGERFPDRFGTDIYTIFNMSEIATPLFTGPNPTVAGTCGQCRDGFELRVVDAHDNELPDGEVGELIVRGDLPWTMNTGYYKNPEATVEAWRNGWFHTGDGFRRDADGNYFFVDRIKDAIRRRGENISSAEVESVVADYPAVAEVAAIAVPSEFGEDEVMVVLVPKDGQSIDPVELTNFLIERMAHFMVPRYVRIVDALPKTPTTKIQKAELRKTGVTPDTWDREAAGMRLRAERLG